MPEKFPKKDLSDYFEKIIWKVGYHYLEIDELEESLELRVFMKKLFAELTWCFLRTPSYEISVLLFFSDFKEVLLEMVENSELAMKVDLYRAFFKN